MLPGGQLAVLTPIGISLVLFANQGDVRNLNLLYHARRLILEKLDIRRSTTRALSHFVVMKVINGLGRVKRVFVLWVARLPANFVVQVK